MSEDGEIEFLDEDADIVQQCVEGVENTVVADNDKVELGAPLLVERVPNEKSKSNKRKRKKDSDDSDYDPTEELQLLRKHKRRQQMNLPQQIRQTPVLPVSKPVFEPTIKVLEQREAQKKPRLISRYDLSHRKKLDIRIPDYEDPLCLPVRATKLDDPVLRSWNNLCLEQFKRCEKALRAEEQETISSKRTVVLRNQRHMPSGIVETTMYSKLSVENKNGAKKAELLQSVLPKYREKKIIYNFQLLKKKATYQKFRNKTEVLLTKEVGKGCENLVAYETRDALSSVYRMIEEKSDANDANESEDKKYLKEMVCCKVCACCYQGSWRGGRVKLDYKKLVCQICKEPTESIYMLLSHYKSHSTSEIQAQKSTLTQMLAQAVGYHYKCRICQKQCASIKALRDHVNTHKGTTLFVCEVGNHVTK